MEFVGRHLVAVLAGDEGRYNLAAPHIIELRGWGNVRGVEHLPSDMVFEGLACSGEESTEVWGGHNGEVTIWTSVGGIVSIKAIAVATAGRLLRTQKVCHAR